MAGERDGEIDLEAVRPLLMGVAHRVLGSWADAADAVQDALLAWARADQATIDDHRAWLVSVCVRRAIDRTRAASRAKVDYVGTWLPDVVAGDVFDDPGMRVELSATATTAFLLVLQRLAPKERAAFVLHDVLGWSHEEIARALGVTAAAGRQLVSRGRRHVAGAHRLADRGDRAVHEFDAGQRRALAAFRRGIESDDFDALAELLVEDARLAADGGGLVPTVAHVVTGRDHVLSFVAGTLGPAWRSGGLVEVDVNGGRGLAVVIDGRLNAVLTVEVAADGRLAAVYVQRNPVKLAHSGIAGTSQLAALVRHHVVGDPPRSTNDEDDDHAPPHPHRAGDRQHP